MADDDTKDTKGNDPKGNDLRAQVLADINKSKRESLKGKLKGLFTKKEEHLLAIRLIDDEVNKMIEDFEAGRL